MRLVSQSPHDHSFNVIPLAPSSLRLLLCGVTPHAKSHHPSRLISYQRPILGLNREIDMQPFLLRQFWQLIEETQTSQLLGMDDTSLAKWLTHELIEHNIALDRTEASAITSYIRQKTPLIRDLAYQRAAGSFS
jgi:hypothetical protein